MFTLCHIAMLVVLSTSFIQVLLVGGCLKLFTMYDDYIAGLSGHEPQLVHVASLFAYPLA
jgi:hypothetical protein